MKKLLFIVAVATIGIISCQKEIEFEPTQQDNYAFTASIEQLANPTKATMGEGYQLQWATGDQIGVYGNTEGNKSFTLDGTGGSASGTFIYDEGTYSATDASVAFFPWQGAGSDYNNVYGGTAYFKLNQNYDGYASGKMYTPLVAPISRTGDVYDPIEFKHAGAAIQVTFNSFPAGAKDFGMIAKDDQYLRGNFSINPANAGTDGLALIDDALKGKDIWMHVNPASEAAPFTFIFPVPALTTPKLSFELWDENGILVWSKNLKAQTNSIARGDVLVMPALDITPYSQFNAISSEWTVIGTANGSNWDKDFPMVTDGTKCIAKGLSFAADGSFRIRKDGDWTTAYPSGNWNIWEGAGQYDIIFDTTTDTDNIKVVKSKCPYPDANSNVKLYVHSTTTVENELCIKSDALGTSAWPGTPFSAYEIVAGQKYYTMEFPASKVWGKTITDLYIVDRDTWVAKDGGCTLTFPGNKDEYFIVATKNTDLVLLGQRPSEPSISINGAFTDWTNVSGNSYTNTAGNTALMKAYSDGTDLYVYLQLTPGSGDTYDLSSGRYFRLYFDTDNDATGTYTEWYRKGADDIPGGVDSFLVYFNHSGSVANADIQGIGTDYEIKVVDNSGASLEVELKAPLSVLGTITGDEIKIFALGYKGGTYSEFTGSISGVMIP